MPFTVTVINAMNTLHSRFVKSSLKLQNETCFVTCLYLKIVITSPMAVIPSPLATPYLIHRYGFLVSYHRDKKLYFNVDILNIKQVRPFKFDNRLLHTEPQIVTMNLSFNQNTTFVSNKMERKSSGLKGRLYTHIQL